MSDGSGQLALDALYEVIDEINLELREEQRLAKDPETRIFGEEDGLDSIDLVRLVVLYEQAMADATGTAISISDDRAMSNAHSHFRTVRSLVDYTLTLLDEASGAD